MEERKYRRIFRSTFALEPNKGSELVETFHDSSEFIKGVVGAVGSEDCVGLPIYKNSFRIESNCMLNIKMSSLKMIATYVCSNVKHCKKRRNIFRLY